MNSSDKKKDSSQKYIFSIFILFAICYIAYVFLFDQSDLPLDDLIKNVKSGETPF